MDNDDDPPLLARTLRIKSAKVRWCSNRPPLAVMWRRVGIEVASEWMANFGIGGASQSRMVNEIGAVDNLRLENQLTEWTSLVRQLAVGQHQPSIAARVCGICTSVQHPIDMCPTLQETESDYPESVGAIGGYRNGKQPYQSRPFDNQQFGKQPFWLGPSQGPYASQ
ncbi:hypothetical protein CR513_05533, partial [Mucuna pruriens]